MTALRTLSQAKEMAMEAAPTVFPTLANLANDPWYILVFNVSLAMTGGAIVGGVMIPVAEEVMAGKFNGIPYFFWCCSLWLACAGWLRAKNWKPFIWFTCVLLLISSWV
jgi:hypothetical protein